MSLLWIFYGVVGTSATIIPAVFSFIVVVLVLCILGEFEPIMFLDMNPTRVIRYLTLEVLVVTL